jgi:hypothetical protein
MGCYNSKIIDETTVESPITPIEDKIENNKPSIKTKFQVNIIRPNPMSEFDPANLRIQIPKIK